MNMYSAVHVCVLCKNSYSCSCMYRQMYTMYRNRSIFIGTKPGKRKVSILNDRRFGITSVVDPDSFDADHTFHFDADPDPIVITVPFTAGASNSHLSSMVLGILSLHLQDRPVFPHITGVHSGKDVFR
jgi:hypothetical protein